ncbi:hypothetical protein P3T37_002263 [Kitasatospora sp. MAA4]|uniref:ATP-binding protein n=1 Tax=Kitasatospora sp. MAA4 TaxID=3035093 RepID=UPI0024768670|nr:ATP-binding protein [Kitasatospora sp. MAA4]MDH6132877.1 hypothetical protein [Kitasatospora sp. MAA4]
MALMVAREVPTSSTMAVPHGPASVGAARRRLRRDLGDREVPETVIDDAVLILSELLSNSCRYARPLAPLLDLDRGAEGEFGDPRQPVPNAASSGAARSAHAPCVECAVGAAPGPAVGTIPADGPREHTDGDDPGGVLVRWQMHTDGLLTLEVTDGGAATRPLPASPSLTSKGGRGLSIVGELAADWGVRDAPGEVTVWAALPARVEHAAEHATGHATGHGTGHGTEHARSA